MMVLCNVFVWTFFVKALHQPGGSIVATVTATATNYCCSVDIQTHFCEEAKFGQKHQIKVTLIFFRRQLETGYLTSTSQCCGGLVPLLLWLVSCLCHQAVKIIPYEKRLINVINRLNHLLNKYFLEKLLKYKRFSRVYPQFYRNYYYCSILLLNNAIQYKRIECSILMSANYLSH